MCGGDDRDCARGSLMNEFDEHDLTNSRGAFLSSLKRKIKDYTRFKIDCSITNASRKQAYIHHCYKHKAIQKVMDESRASTPRWNTSQVAERRSELILSQVPICRNV
jgi:hypothetical protein